MEDRQISPKAGGLRRTSGIHGFKGGSCQLFFIGVVLQRLGAPFWGPENDDQVTVVV